MNLENVHVGDAVAVRLGWRGSLSKHAVAAVSARQVTLDDGRRFVRGTGRLVGGAAAIDPIEAEPWNEDHDRSMELQEARDLRHELSDMLLRNKPTLTLDQLRRIKSIAGEKP